MILSKVFSLEFITLVLIKGAASETFQPSVKVTESKSQLDRVVDRVKPWFMVNGLPHGS